MMIRRKSGCIAFALLASVVVAPNVFAQRRPAPPPPAEAPPPPEFEPLYIALGEPEMVVTVVSLGNVPEDRRRSFESRLSEQFQGNSGLVVIKNPKADELRQIRNFETMIANDADDAARALANRVNADMVVLLKLDGVGSDIEAAYTIYDKNRGQNLARHSWTIPADRGVVGNRQVGYWCATMYEHMYTKLERFTRVAATYTINVVDMPDHLEREFRSELRRIHGVEGKVRLQQDRAKGRNVSSFTLRYGDGDELDLRYFARKALSKLMKIEVSDTQAWSTADGDITVYVLPRETPDEFAGLDGNEKPEHTEKVDAFKEVYLNVGQPRIGLVINHKVYDAAQIRGSETKDREEVNAKVESGDTKVDIEVNKGGSSPKPTIRPGDHNIWTQFDLMQTRHIEDNMTQRFLNLGLEVVSVRSQVQQIVKEHDYQLSAIDDYELALQYLNQDVADIVVVGLGDVVSVGSLFELRYTFRAYTPRDSRLIAIAQPMRSIKIAESDNVNELLMKAETGIAEDAVRTLAGRMMRHWSSPGRVHFEVHNIGSDEGMLAITDWIDSKIGGEHIKSLVRGSFKAGSGEESGRGSFDVVYESNYEAFVRALHDAVNDPGAPFSISSQEVGRQIIRLKAKLKG